MDIMLYFSSNKILDISFLYIGVLYLLVSIRLHTRLNQRKYFDISKDPRINISSVQSIQDCGCVFLCRYIFCTILVT